MLKDQQEPARGLTDAEWKAVLAVPLLGIACVLTGLFGVVEAQLSYTVSPRFFFDGYFSQHHVPTEWHNRWGAARIGVLDWWWIGLCFAEPLLFIACWLPTVRLYWTLTLRAYGVTLFVMVCALVQALIGGQSIDWKDIPAWAKVNFWRGDPQGFMNVLHFQKSASLGILIGAATATLYLLAETVLYVVGANQARSRLARRSGGAAC